MERRQTAVSQVCLKKMTDKTVIPSHMQNKTRTNQPDFHHTVRVQKRWFSSRVTYQQRLDFYLFYHLYKAALPQSPDIQTQQGKQEETGTNLAMNNVCRCLCISCCFEGDKGKVVHRAISLTLAGISVKEMIQHF